MPKSFFARSQDVKNLISLCENFVKGSFRFGNQAIKMGHSTLVCLVD